MTKTEAMQIVGGILVLAMLADILGFAAWIISGQLPVDNFYLGTITANILKAILGA